MNYQYNNYNQQGQYYGQQMQGQMQGQMNYNQQKQPNQNIAQQNGDEDFGDFVTVNQQQNQSKSQQNQGNKYDAFSNLAGAGDFNFNSSPVKQNQNNPNLGQGKTNQMGGQNPMNHNMQSQNQNLQNNNVGGQNQNGYPNQYYQQQQQQQAYYYQQSQQQNQNFNNVQGSGNQQFNSQHQQYYNTHGMDTKAISNINNSANYNTSNQTHYYSTPGVHSNNQMNASGQFGMQPQQQMKDGFGNFSTAQSQQNYQHGFNQQNQQHQLQMQQYQQYQLMQQQQLLQQQQQQQQQQQNSNQNPQQPANQNPQQQQIQNQKQNIKQKAIDNAFDSLINETIGVKPSPQKEIDDFGDFSTAQTAPQNQYQQQHQQQQQFGQYPNQLQNAFQNVQQQDEDFGDFTTSNIGHTQNGQHQNQSNLSALTNAFGNMSSNQPNTLQQQTNNQKDSDDFGDFSSANVNSQVTQVQQSNQFSSLNNAFNNMTQPKPQQQQNIQKDSDEFGDFSTANNNPPTTVINHQQQNNQLSSINNAFNSISIANTQQTHQQNTQKESDDFGDFSEAQTAAPVVQQVKHTQSTNQSNTHDLFGDNMFSKGAVQQNNQKESDDFGDFVDNTAKQTQQPQQPAYFKQLEGPDRFNIFYELEKQNQKQQEVEKQQKQISTLDMPIENITQVNQVHQYQQQQQQTVQQNQAINQNLFGDDEENEDDFGDFQATGAGQNLQQVTHQQAGTSNDMHYPQHQQNAPNYATSYYIPNKPAAEIEKDLIGNVISLFDDYKHDHPTAQQPKHQVTTTSQQNIKSQTHIPAQNQGHENKDEDEFGDFADFQDGNKGQDAGAKVVQQPIHAYDLDWDSIIKQNQQVASDLQPQENPLQDEIQIDQFKQESKLQQKKHNHTQNLFEVQSGDQNNGGASSIQDQVQQGDNASSQADNFNLDFDKKKKKQQAQKKDFEDDLQGDVAADYDFGEFETNQQPPAQTNNGGDDNDLFGDFESSGNNQPQKQQNQFIQQSENVQTYGQKKSGGDDDLFGDFQETNQPPQQEPLVLSNNKISSQQQNTNALDLEDEFDDFESAPTQQQQTVPQQEVKIMDLKEFEMNTFDITALDYGENAKQKVEQQKRDQERKKQEEEERQRKLKEQQEKSKLDKLNSIPQFKVGKQLYKGEYWRKVFEEEETYYLDNKFYEDLIQEIDSLGFYQHFEKLIQIREGLQKINELEKQRKQAKDDGNYEQVFQLKQQISELEQQKDNKSDIVSLVYQIAACDGKCFSHLIYDRLRKLDNALLFVKQFQQMYDQNRDIDELIDFMIICTTIDNNFTSYVHKIFQVQQTCESELLSFESHMDNFQQYNTKIKEEIVAQQQFQDYIKACSLILYHGKRYSKISASLNSQKVDFDMYEKTLTNQITQLNKQFNTKFEQIKKILQFILKRINLFYAIINYQIILKQKIKNFSFTEELTMEQREKLINDIVNGESNLNLTEFICNLCLGVANETKVHYRGSYYHNLCINIWFNKISTIID